MKITLEQIRAIQSASPPTNPQDDELYLDDGTNTLSGSTGWRQYKDSAWVDIGVQEVTNMEIDGGPF